VDMSPRMSLCPLGMLCSYPGISTFLPMRLSVMRLPQSILADVFGPFESEDLGCDLLGKLLLIVWFSRQGHWDLVRLWVLLCETGMQNEFISQSIFCM